MLTSRSKKAVAFGIAFTATLGAALINGSAGADPKQYSAAVGVGSDTVQDVMNALAGGTNGVTYTPINSGSATGSRQVISFDASVPTGVSDTCITTKLNGPTFTRPFGSGAGLKALTAATGGSTAGWLGVPINGVATCTTTAVSINGQVDFARSSKGPASGDAGTALTYIPFGRDAMSFASYRASGSPVTSLTRGQLTTLFTTGPQVINGVRVVPCGIQTSSGTYAFWQLVTTASATQENTATTECNALLGIRSEENDGAALKARGDALAATTGHSTDQVVIGFSAGSYVAKSNLVAPGAPPAGVVMGSISDNGSGTNLGSPINGSGTSLTPSQTFYNDTVFGRDVYVVVNSTTLGSPGSATIKALFSGPSAAICGAAANATVNLFGFLDNSSCGSTVLKGSFVPGIS